MLQNQWQTVKFGLLVLITTLILTIGTIAMTPVKTLAQLTSVTQLRDVQPTDYYYQALQYLVEQYGCFVGYPDGTFRADKDLARYELASQITACFDRFNEFIASSPTTDGVTKEEVVIMKTLINEMQKEVDLIRRSRQTG